MHPYNQGYQDYWRHDNNTENYTQEEIDEYNTGLDDAHNCDEYYQEPVNIRQELDLWHFDEF